MERVKTHRFFSWTPFTPGGWGPRRDRESLHRVVAWWLRAASRTRLSASALLGMLVLVCQQSANRHAELLVQLAQLAQIDPSAQAGTNQHAEVTATVAGTRPKTTANLAAHA